MFRISRRLDYGLQLMIALALESDNRAQATAILAEKLQIPLPFLHQIGRSLIQGRLIKATPGPHGGLRLNVPAEDITMLQIVETLEGPICITPLLDGESCQRQETWSSNNVWTGLQGRLIEHLANIRLNTLAMDAKMPVAELVSASSNGKNN